MSKLDFIIIVWNTDLGIISIHVTWRGTHFYSEGYIWGEISVKIRLL